jgi:hypothetical protein
VDTHFIPSGNKLRLAFFTNRKPENDVALKLHETVRSLLIIIVRLLKQEVCRQLFILVTRKVSLNDLIARETQPAQSLDGVALLLGDLDRSCPRRKRTAFSAFTLGIL